MNINSIISLVFFTITNVDIAKPSVIRNQSLVQSCGIAEMGRLYILSEASNKIFELHAFIGSPVSRRSKRLRREHAVDILQDTAGFMRRMHHKITSTLSDLNLLRHYFAADQLKSTAELGRALEFMAEIIELRFLEIDELDEDQSFAQEEKLARKTRNVEPNMNLVEERARLAMRHIIEAFLSVASQCPV